MSHAQKTMDDEPVMTAEVARFLLSYDEDAGTLRWRVGTGRSARKGSIAGCASTHSKGYPVVKIFGRRYMAHRLAWLIVHGCWPIHQIDHINRDVTDFRLCNLRQASDSQQRMNSKRRVDNTSGFKGVHRSKKRWAASIAVDKRSHHLGTIDTPEEAHSAYCKAAALIHGQFARTT